MSQTPQCRFYQFHKSGRPPQRAGRDALGTLSVRASQYCDAVTTASGFGWWLFPPTDIHLVWNGHSMFWSTDAKNWEIIDDVVNFPGFPEDFDAVVPDKLRGQAPAYLTALPEPGLVQISLGVFVRTAPGWSMLIKRPSNFPLTSPVEHYEGVLDTSTWFGPLFINLRLTKTDVPIRLRADLPLAQAQPLLQSMLVPAMLAFETAAPGPDEWQAYLEGVVEPNKHSGRALGAYAVAQRRNRKRADAEVA